MAYRFKRSDVSVEAGTRRIGSDQVRLAIAEIDDPCLSPDDTIHQVRKRCKKLRALLRLVRPVFHGYETENALIRDAAAELSSARDAAVLISAYESLRKAHNGRLHDDNWDAIRDELVRHRRSVANDEELIARLAAFRTALVAAGKRIANLELDGDGFAAFAAGLKKTYSRARRAAAQSNNERIAETFHEWRKRVKDHWHHACLLRSIRPRVTKPHRKAAFELSEQLGRHHDLAVLEIWLQSGPGQFGDPELLVRPIRVIKVQREALEAEAFALGQDVFRQRPKDLCKVWSGYWGKWRGSSSRDVSF